MSPKESPSAARPSDSLLAGTVSRTLGRIGCIFVLFAFFKFVQLLDWMFTTRAGGGVLAILTALGVILIVTVRRATTRAAQEQSELVENRRNIQRAAARKREASAEAIADLLNKVLPGTRSTAFAGGRFGTTLCVKVDGVYAELPPDALEYAKRTFHSAGFNRVVIDDAHGRAKTFFT